MFTSLLELVGVQRLRRKSTRTGGAFELMGKGNQLQDKRNTSLVKSLANYLVEWRIMAESIPEFRSLRFLVGQVQQRVIHW